MPRNRTAWHTLRRGVAAIVLLAFVAACSTTRPVALGTPSSLAEEVQPGDRVRLTTTDGRKLDFEVVRVEPEALVGDDLQVALDDIAVLEVTEISAGRTAAAVGGTGLAVFIIMGLIVAAIAPALILAGG